ncbi:MAG: siderophore-interacting protein [Propioniciclava sp.]|uniref:siderophore-interacting protein n=1 Tax=Propioniciclava sp. TaxID=2038686 RepID=UPI0039E5D03E
MNQVIRHELHARVGAVAEVIDLAPRMRRVVIELAAGSPPVPWVRLAVGDHVKLAFPDASGRLNLPAQPGVRPAPGEPRPVLRDYTVRAVPDAAHAVFDFVLHGDGPASTWASNATVGSPLGVLGPRGSRVMPGDRPRYLCLIDSTALPAAARWMEEAPADAVVEVAVEGPAETIAALPTRANGSLTRVEGTDGSGLVAYLTGHRPHPGDLVWAAGETSSMIAVRRAAAALGVSREDLDVHGYWKQGVANRDHHAPLED